MEIAVRLIFWKNVLLLARSLLVFHVTPEQRFVLQFVNRRHVGTEAFWINQHEYDLSKLPL